MEHRGLAERQGFEPWIRCRIRDFESRAFDHSAISPQPCIIPGSDAPARIDNQRLTTAPTMVSFSRPATLLEPRMTPQQQTIEIEYINRPEVSETFADLLERVTCLLYTSPSPRD